VKMSVARLRLRRQLMGFSSFVLGDLRGRVDCGACV
jgi:hypothetical protein